MQPSDLPTITPQEALLHETAQMLGFLCHANAGSRGEKG